MFCRAYFFLHDNLNSYASLRTSSGKNICKKLSSKIIPDESGSKHDSMNLTLRSNKEHKN